VYLYAANKETVFNEIEGVPGVLEAQTLLVITEME